MTADNINLRNIEETTIMERCRIGNKQIISETKIKGETQINLPLECSISSNSLRCGRVKYLFENEEINQARIRRVSVIQSQNNKKEPKKQQRIHHRNSHRKHMFHYHNNNDSNKKIQNQHTKRS